MKTYPMPNVFDGAKFAVRYGLSAIHGDFWSDGVLLHVPDGLPDDPPIFEAPDLPQDQGKITWENSSIPGALRLVVTHNNRKTIIAGAIGADPSLAAMYQSPGPISPFPPAGPRREFHVASKVDIVNIPVPVVDGDTLYVFGDGEYRFSNGTWRRILYGPTLDSPADQVDLYASLDAKLDLAINPPQGPQIDPRIKAVLVELRKLV